MRKRLLVLGLATCFAGGALATPTALAKDNKDAKDQCKNGGWQTLTDSNGNGFKNQGQCIKYVNHGGEFGGGGGGGGGSTLLPIGGSPIALL